MPPANEPKETNTGVVFGLAAAGFIFVLVAISQCSSKPTATSQPFAAPELQNAIAAIPAEPVVKALDAASVGRGFNHARLVVNAEGLSGAMIYSQNCYDALSRQFSWAKLDACGGFDMLIARSAVDADTTDLQSETTYFGSEAAAARYLAAATAAGEEAEKADLRLEELQGRAGKGRAVLPGKATPTPEGSPTDTNKSDSGEEEKLDEDWIANMTGAG